jgi:hypothetical protein
MRVRNQQNKQHEVIQNAVAHRFAEGISGNCKYFIQQFFHHAALCISSVFARKTDDTIDFTESKKDCR